MGRIGGPGAPLCSPLPFIRVAGPPGHRCLCLGRGVATEVSESAFRRALGSGRLVGQLLAFPWWLVSGRAAGGCVGGGLWLGFCGGHALGRPFAPGAGRGRGSVPLPIPAGSVAGVPGAPFAPAAAAWCCCWLLVGTGSLGGLGGRPLSPGFLLGLGCAAPPPPAVRVGCGAAGVGFAPLGLPRHEGLTVREAGSTIKLRSGKP